MTSAATITVAPRDQGRPITLRVRPALMMELRELAESADPIDTTEPTEPIDAAEPTEKIDATEPIEPTDNSEPRHPMHNSESSDHSDKLEPMAQDYCPRPTLRVDLTTR